MGKPGGRACASRKNPNRPIASFIFCGPTGGSVLEHLFYLRVFVSQVVSFMVLLGVGKTELCKALAAAYFGKEVRVREGERT